MKFKYLSIPAQIYWLYKRVSFLLQNIGDGCEGGGKTDLTHTTTANDVTINSSTGTNTTIPSANESSAGVLTKNDYVKLQNLGDSASTDLGHGTSTTDVTITSSTGSNTTVPAATQDKAGVMSAFDKVKLDEIVGDQVPTNLGHTKTATTVEITSSTGNNTSVSEATETQAGVMSAAQVVKLNNIETAPTNLGNTRAASSVVVTSSTGDNTTIPEADTSEAGVMSATDKTKLNGLVGHIPTNLSNTPTEATVQVVSSTGDNTTIAAATQAFAGVMSKDDKKKLDEIDPVGEAYNRFPVASDIVTSRASVLTDIDGLNRVTSDADIVYTLDGSVAFEDDVVIPLVRNGNGDVSIEYSNGASGPSGIKTYRQYDTISMRHAGGNVWETLDPPIDASTGGNLGILQPPIGGTGATLIDWSLGDQVELNLTQPVENITFAPYSQTGVVTLTVIQDVGGGKDIAFDESVIWEDDAPLPIATTGKTIIRLYFNGSEYYVINFSSGFLSIDNLYFYEDVLHPTKETDTLPIVNVNENWITSTSTDVDAASPNSQHSLRFENITGATSSAGFYLPIEFYGGTYTVKARIKATSGSTRLLMSEYWGWTVTTVSASIYNSWTEIEFTGLVSNYIYPSIRLDRNGNDAIGDTAFIDDVEVIRTAPDYPNVYFLGDCMDPINESPTMLPYWENIGKINKEVDMNESFHGQYSMKLTSILGTNQEEGFRPPIFEIGALYTLFIRQKVQDDSTWQVSLRAQNGWMEDRFGNEKDNTDGLDENGWARVGVYDITPYRTDAEIGFKCATGSPNTVCHVDGIRVFKVADAPLNLYTAVGDACADDNESATLSPSWLEEASFTIAVHSADSYKGNNSVLITNTTGGNGEAGYATPTLEVGETYVIKHRIKIIDGAHWRANFRASDGWTEDKFSSEVWTTSYSEPEANGWVERVVTGLVPTITNPTITFKHTNSVDGTEGSALIDSILIIKVS